MAVKSFTDGGSILSGNNNNIDGEQSSTQNKRKKSVRFQVYDAKNMSALQEMRTTMAEKLDSFKERSITPTGRYKFQPVMSPPSQQSFQGSLSFKPGMFSEIIGGGVIAKKTPRPEKLGQPVSDDDQPSQRVNSNQQTEIEYEQLFEGNKLD